jgi:hypothetical protein
LAGLPQAEIDMADTVVLPPARPLEVDAAMRGRLDELDQAESGRA